MALPGTLSSPCARTSPLRPPEGARLRPPALADDQGAFAVPWWVWGEGDCAGLQVRSAVLPRGCVSPPVAGIFEIERQAARLLDTRPCPLYSGTSSVCIEGSVTKVSVAAGARHPWKRGEERLNRGLLS